MSKASVVYENHVDVSFNFLNLLHLYIYDMIIIHGNHFQDTSTHRKRPEKSIFESSCIKRRSKQERQNDSKYDSMNYY